MRLWRAGFLPPARFCFCSCIWNLSSAGQGPDVGVMDWEGDQATALSVTNGSAVELDVTINYYLEAWP